MRRIVLVLFALSWILVAGCSGNPPAAKPLSPDEEKQLQQKIEKARQAEGGAATK